jgi:hypothetical protein
MYTNCAKIIFLAFSLCYLLDLAESAFMGLLLLFGQVKIKKKEKEEVRFNNYLTFFFEVILGLEV